MLATSAPTSLHALDLAGVTPAFFHLPAVLASSACSRHPFASFGSNPFCRHATASPGAIPTCFHATAASKTKPALTQEPVSPALIPAPRQSSATSGERGGFFKKVLLRWRQKHV